MCKSMNKIKINVFICVFFFHLSTIYTVSPYANEVGGAMAQPETGLVRINSARLVWSCHQPCSICLITSQQAPLWHHCGWFEIIGEPFREHCTQWLSTPWYRWIDWWLTKFQRWLKYTCPDFTWLVSFALPCWQKSVSQNELHQTTVVCSIVNKALKKIKLIYCALK